MDNNQLLNDLYQAGLITVGAVGVSMLVKKLTGQGMATPVSLKETAKLAVAVAVGSFAVKTAQQKGYIPLNVEPTKKT